MCVKNCAHGAVSLVEVATEKLSGAGNAEAGHPRKKAFIDQSKCVGCGQCVATCQFFAAWADRDEQLNILNCKIAEYAKAVIQNKPNFHVAIIVDVSPECDCWGHNDAPIVPNIGMAASFDPVALDCACSDLVNRTPILMNDNTLTEHHSHEECEHDHDHWDFMHPDTDWKSCVVHAEKMGIGAREYELVEVK